MDCQFFPFVATLPKGIFDVKGNYEEDSTKINGAGGGPLLKFGDMVHLSEPGRYNSKICKR